MSVKLIDHFENRPVCDHLEIMDSLRGAGFDVKKGYLGKEETRTSPLGEKKVIMTYGSWWHILPNYEICSKEKPVLPCFNFDNERIIYLVVMTNRPIKDEDMDVSINLTMGGIFLTLFPRKGEGDGIHLIKKCYLNPEILEDFKKVKIKVIQMAGIEDFFRFFDTAYRRLFEASQYIVGEYKDELESAGHKGLAPVHYRSGLFNSTIDVSVASGRINYPLIEISDTAEALYYADPKNLEIVCRADQSRVHQLPMPVREITSHNAKLWSLANDYEDKIQDKKHLFDSLRKRFWPVGLAKNIGPEFFRNPCIGNRYPAIELSSLFYKKK